jgi:hypothetical protein
MPSFYEAIKRIIQGKPVYDATDNPEAPATDAPDAPPAEAAAEPQSTIQKNDASTFPVVQVTRTESRPNGQTLQIYCTLRNNWQEQVDVDSITLFGNEYKLRISLGPGQEREVVTYNGPLLTSTRGSEAVVIYKTETGDYFEAVHEIHYSYTPEKTYDVTDLSLHLPIRDIYG